MSVIASLQEDPLDTASLVAPLRGGRVGGLVVFEGVVRADPTGGGEVVSLTYEAYPALAEPALRALAGEAAKRFGLSGALFVHRTGTVRVGEPAVVVAAAAAHRAEAFAGCRWLVERLKEEVPIWKREAVPGGPSEWSEVTRAQTPPATGVVLAGGRSRRMEEEKGLVELGGRPLASYAVDALSAVCERTLIVANAPGYERLGVPVIADRVPGAGPLAGIDAGLAAAETDLIVVAACDMPFATPWLFRRMLLAAEGYDVVAPATSSGWEPCLAVYRKTCGPALDEALLEGDRVAQGFLAAVRTRPFRELTDADLWALWSLNTKEDLRRAEALLAGTPRLGALGPAG